MLDWRDRDELGREAAREGGGGSPYRTALHKVLCCTELRSLCNTGVFYTYDEVSWGYFWCNVALMCVATRADNRSVQVTPPEPLCARARYRCRGLCGEKDGLKSPRKPWPCIFLNFEHICSLSSAPEVGSWAEAVEQDSKFLSGITLPLQNIS